MTRDDMIKMFTNMIDDAFQAGWELDSQLREALGG